MAMKTASKYDDINFKALIHSGSPTVYQWTARTAYSGRLKTMTLGTKDPAKTNKTILLVGETGTGKSTLVNALVNYAVGVAWEDDVWFQIVDDEKRHQSGSQKSEVVQYQIFGFEGEPLPFSLTIIDTPGYGDTRGVQRDDIIRESLLDLFRSDDGVNEISVVGLVLKASESRLSDRLRYILDSALSLFGKDLEENIVVLVTHSDGLTPKSALNALDAANVKSARNHKNQPVHFLFDNCQQDDRTEEPEDLQRAERITTRGLKQFMDFLRRTEPQTTKTTLEVLNERIRLNTCIQNLQEKVRLMEPQQKEIQQVQASVKKSEDKMNENQVFVEEVDKVYKSKETLRGRATCCMICEENCHYPGCTVALHPECCEVIRVGFCTVCKGRCHVQYHVKENWRFVEKIRKVPRTNEDMKMKYEKNKSKCQRKLRLLEDLQKNLEEPQGHLDQYLEEAFQHVVTLDQIALNPDSLSTWVHLDVMMEKMEEKGDAEKVQKLKEMKRRVDEDRGIRVGLMYMST